MQVAYLVFLLLLALSFLVAGYIVRMDKRSNFLFLAGFVVLLVAGMFNLPGVATPMEFRTGETEVATTSGNVTSTVVQYTYTPISATQSSTLSLILILAALYGITASYMAARSVDEVNYDNE